MGAELGVSGAKSDPNVVPLCDILLVLLIIFMVITPIAQKGIDIQLPETSTEAGKSGPNTTSVVLTLESDNSIKLNAEVVAPELLLNRLRDIFQTRPNKTIFIRADQSVYYSEVLKVIDLAKGAGIEVLGVYTTQYETNPQ
ncbi:MAG: biopolymer transporter ExbD [bacterium]|nr:biopolymer transporter ExbD [bacterium]